MTKFAYITDNHLGGDDNSWSQQKLYPHLVTELFQDLANYLQQNPVDFVLHGGDLTNSGNIEEIEKASHIAKSLKCPLRLVLGNHDLGLTDSITHWRSQNTLFPQNTTPTCDFTIDLGTANLIALTNTWQAPNQNSPFHWTPQDQQLSGLTPPQYHWLESQLSASKKPTILAMHESLYPLPPRLTGMPDEIHAPAGPYIKELNQFIQEHEQIKLVLSGHCHASCITHENATTYITTSSFSEPPFQIRIIETSQTQIEISTACPVAMEKYNAQFNPEIAWTAGHPQDQNIKIPI